MPGKAQKVLIRAKAIDPQSEVALEAEAFGIERRRPQIFAYAQSKAGQSVHARIAHYNSEKAEFEAALRLWPNEYAQQLRDTLAASRFIDWAHMAPDIMETFRSRGRLSVLERGLQFLYSSSPKQGLEFGNMRAVNKFLRLFFKSVVVG